MKLYFIFSNLNAIVLAIWTMFLIIVAIRYFRPDWVKNISYFKLLLIAIGLNIFYGLFVTWGQYHVWANGNQITKALLSSPLGKEVPLPFLLEWIRPLFEHSYGYFLFYVLGRTWLDTSLLFLISGAVYSLFRIWKSYRGGFLEQGPEILLILMLASGYPGILVFIPIGFILAVLFSIYSSIRGKASINIEPAFIVAAFVALIFAPAILNVLQ